MNARQALKALNVNSNASQEEIKSSYRKMALELHPDKNKEKKDDVEFKKITEAYNFLKKNEKDDTIYEQTKQDSGNQGVKPKPQWGAPNDGGIPEQDWGKYTSEFEEGDPTFWKEYEKKLAEAHKMSTINRKKSDELIFEAEQLFKQMELKS